MQDMQLICAIDFRLRLLESNAPAQRISRIDDSRVPVLHPHIQGGMIRKPVAQQRIRARIPGAATPSGIPTVCCQMGRASVTSKTLDAE